MNRIFKYDFIRVVGMILICILNINALIGSNTLLSSITKTICISAVGLFFMLSGKFNLNKNFEHKHDYCDFYSKRIIFLLIPFMLVLLLYVYNISLKQSLGKVALIELIFNNQIHNSFLFMFYLFTYLFTAPFLGIMNNNMNKQDKKVFFIIFVIIDLLLMLQNITGFHSSFDKGAFPLMNYCFYFLLGAMIDDVFASDKLKNITIILLPIIILIKIIIHCYYPDSVVLTGLNPLFTFEIIGMYFLLIKISEKMHKHLKSIINGLSKHSFTFYLINPLLINLLSKYFDLTQGYIQMVIFGLGVILSSIVVAWLLDELIIKRIIAMFWLFYRKVVIKQREVEICAEK